MSKEFDPYYKWLGIPPKDQPPHHYRLLGIEVFEPDVEVIDAAANRLMAYLQDLSHGEDAAAAQKILNEISSARVCLLDKKRKTDYDTRLKAKTQPQRRLAKAAPVAVASPASQAPKPPPPPATTPAIAPPPSPVFRTADVRPLNTGTNQADNDRDEQPRYRKRKPNVVVPILVVSLAVVGIIVAGVALLSDRKRQAANPDAGPPNTNTRVQVSTTPSNANPNRTPVDNTPQGFIPDSATLDLQWRPNDRKAATLTINGEKTNFEPTGFLTFKVLPGENEIKVTRKGFKPFVRKLDLRPGQYERIEVKLEKQP